MKNNKLIFGVHPFGKAGMPEGVATGAPDDFHKIGQAITELRGGAKDFIVRSYTYYELFGLRDADSANDNMFYQFGIMRDDYTPKPAFETYKNLIRQLS